MLSILQCTKCLHMPKDENSFSNLNNVINLSLSILIAIAFIDHDIDFIADFNGCTSWWRARWVQENSARGKSIVFGTHYDCQYVALSLWHAGLQERHWLLEEQEECWRALNQDYRNQLLLSGTFPNFFRIITLEVSACKNRNIKLKPEVYSSAPMTGKVFVPKEAARFTWNDMQFSEKRIVHKVSLWLLN